jgi:N12 class adenine-specific DNA methylase
MDTSVIVPAQAGTRREAGRMFHVWLRLRNALLKGLYLADPWVSAYAGTTTEIALETHTPAFAAMK